MQANDPNNKPLSVPRVSRPGTDSPPLPLQLASAGHGDPFAGPPGLSNTPTWSGLVQAFRRRWLLALTTAVLAAVAAYVLVPQVMPGRFTAEARLQVSARSPAAFLIETGETQVDPLIFKSNQESILKSTPVLNAALNRPEVKALPAIRDLVNPTAWLDKAIKVEFKGGEIMHLSMTGDNPEELRALVNAVALAYVEFSESRDKEVRLTLLEKLTTSYKEAQDSLRDKQRLLQTIRVSRKIDDPETIKLKFESVLRQVDATKKELITLELKAIGVRGELNARQAEEQGLSKQVVPDVVVDRYLKDDAVFKQFLVDMAKINDDIAKTRMNVNEDEAPRVLAPFYEARANVLRDLAAYRKAQAPQVVEQQRQDLQVAIAKLKLEAQSVNDQRTAMEAEIKRQEDEVRRLTPGRQVMPDVDALVKDIAERETALGKLGDKRQALQLAPALGSQVTLLQRADLPQTPDLSRQAKVAIGGSAAAFFLLLFGVSFWEFRTRKIGTADEVVRGLGMNLVGTLPALPAQARRAGITQTKGQGRHWEGQLTEAVDGIRTFLLHEAKESDLQVVMVTSANGGEGKTSLAGQLAASLARSWRKTLLIDGDLRNPAVHRVFEQPLEPGFSEVLRGEVGAHDAVRPTAVSRLSVMPAGHWDSHAVQALAQEGVRSLFEQLKEQYDFIVVDSCPVLPVADTLLLGQHVDAVLFAVMRDVSRAPEVYAAEQRLAGLGVHTLGVVLIGATGTDGGARYTYPAQAIGGS